MYLTLWCVTIVFMLKNYYLYLKIYHTSAFHFYIIESLYIINFRISIGEINYGKIIIYIEICYNDILGKYNQNWNYITKNMTKINRNMTCNPGIFVIVLCDYNTKNIIMLFYRYCIITFLN